MADAKTPAAGKSSGGKPGGKSGGSGGKFDFKMLFKGKAKYITIGAIVLVVVLALVFRNRSGSSGSSSLPSETIASGAAAPGLTTSDINNAISDYAERDAANTEKLLGEITAGNAQQYEGLTDMINKINDNSSTMNQSLIDMMNKQMADMTAKLAAIQYQAPIAYDSGYSSGGSSSSGSSSSTSSSSGTTVTHKTDTAKDLQANYDKTHTNLTQEQQSAVDYNRSQLEKFQQSMKGFSTKLA